MLTEPTRIRITPGSELAQLLDKMGDAPLLLEKDGELYSLTKAQDIWAGYDPKRAREALRKSAGAFRSIDRKELLDDIHQARQQDSSGRRA
jgi:hypothetical protein